MSTAPSHAESFPEVRAVLVQVLELDDRPITPETGLLGELPELDSLSVVELAAALEDHFGITFDDEDFTGEVFETVGSLSAFVDLRRSAVSGG